MNIKRPLYNYKPSKQFKSMNSNLSQIEQKIVDDLSNNGISIVHFDDLFPDLDFNKIKQLSEDELSKSDNADLIAQAKKGLSEGRGKFYNVQFWNQKENLDNNDLTDILLNESVIKIASTYLRSICKLYYIDLWYNIPTEGESILSQNWHRDPDDRNCVKVFLYLNDVDVDMGSLSYIPKSPYGNKYGKVFPRGPPNQKSSPPKDVDAKFDGQQITLPGPAGTLVFVDTTGLHKGAHSKTKPRYVLNACFRSNGSYFRYTDEHKRTISKYKTSNFSSDLVKYAIT